MLSFFQKGKFKTALNYYTKVVDFLDSDDRYEGDEVEKRTQLLLAGAFQTFRMMKSLLYNTDRINSRLLGHLNKAMCYLKLENTLEAIYSCDKVLEMEEKNEKALFRKATVSSPLGSGADLWLL